MRICVQNPVNPEFSLCGDASDAAQTEDDSEEFRFAFEKLERVSCEKCLSIIEEIYTFYTLTGRLKK